MLKKGRDFMAFDANKNYAEEIKKATERGASQSEINRLKKEREEKIASDSSKYGQYATTSAKAEAEKYYGSSPKSSSNKSTKADRAIYDSPSTGNPVTKYAGNYDNLVRETAKRNNVDMGVAMEMLLTDMRNPGTVGKYSGVNITPEMRSGYQKALDETIRTMDDRNKKAYEAAKLGLQDTTMQELGNIPQLGDIPQFGDVSQFGDISQFGSASSKYDTNYKPSETLEEYRERRIKEIDDLLKGKRKAGIDAIDRSREDIETESGISQRKLEESYNIALQDLENQAAKIRQEMAAARGDVEARKAETLPTYQTQRTQQAFKYDQMAKQIVDYMKRKGLASGGQVTSELGRNVGQAIASQRNIDTNESNFVRDVENKLSDLTGKEATGLADIEALKGQNTLKLATGKANIIDRVNNALADLTADEKSLIDQLSDIRMQMEQGINTEYQQMTAAEKQQAFDMMLKQMGVENENLRQMNNLISEINQAKQAADELKYKKEASLRDYDIKLIEAEIERQYNQGLIDARERDRAVEWARYEWDKSPDNPKNKPNELKPGDYKTSPDFADDVDWITGNPDSAVNEIKSNSKELIAKYGYEGYKELLDLAENQ